MNADLDLILAAAQEAALVAVDLRAKGLVVEHKEGGSPVTNGDLAVDALLKDRLLTARPDYGWLSEETTDNPDRLAKRRIFLVDPIDGTSAYVKGRDWWTVCIGVVEDGHVVAGVVIAPALGEVYAAAKGEGATLNGQPIHVSDRADVEGCSMLGDPRMFADSRWPEPWPEMKIEARNSVAYRMCLVASGAFDACVAPAPKHDWDMGAADIIVTEAGGLATDVKAQAFIYNRPNPSQWGLICSGPRLHPLLIARVAHIERPYGAQ
jgi:myo-inositol-1(or 4)-monophosphatase